MAEEQPNKSAVRTRNLRTALILGSVALAFGLGVIVKHWLAGQ